MAQVYKPKVATVHCENLCMTMVLRYVLLIETQRELIVLKSTVLLVTIIRVTTLCHMQADTKLQSHHFKPRIIRSGQAICVSSTDAPGSAYGSELWIPKRDEERSGVEKQFIFVFKPAGCFPDCLTTLYEIMPCGFA
jgi:hypothetical protein